MITKEQALAAIQKIMERSGLTKEDVISAWNINVPTTEKSEYEILYTDGTHSEALQTGKTPWGVIIFGCAIHLNEIPDKMGYPKAQNFCSKTIFKSKKCNCGSRIFWTRVISLSEEMLEKLNAFIISIKGQPLKGDYWTTGKCHKNDAWIAYIHKGQKGISSANIHKRIKVRQIIEIAELK